MRKKKKPEISFVEWGGKIVGAVGVLAMASYIAGFSKFYFLYRALGCVWVLSFHSIPDVVTNGAIDVALCSVTAIPLFHLYTNSLDVDNNGRRIVGLILFGMTISLGIAVGVLGFSVDPSTLDLLMYSCFYLFYGVAIAHSARYAVEEGDYNFLLFCFFGFVFSACLSSYLVHQYKTFDNIYEKGGFPYAVDGQSGRAMVLIGAVNGKYLVRFCGEDNKYQLIIPSHKWLVEAKRLDDCLGTTAAN